MHKFNRIRQVALATTVACERFSAVLSALFGAVVMLQNSILI